MRILAVSNNRRGRRYKAFAEAVHEQVENGFPDRPLADSERSMLFVLEKWCAMDFHRWHGVRATSDASDMPRATEELMNCVPWRGFWKLLLCMTR